MDVRGHDDPATFDAATRELYAADPVRHTLALTVIARNLYDPAIAPVMLTVHRDGELYGAAFRSPPWPVVISGLPVDAAPAVAAAAAAVRAGIDPDAPGVTGPREPAEAFARAWADHTGNPVREAMASRLYELGDLLEPSVPGTGRAATEDDVPLLVGWRNAFQVEALGHARENERAEEITRAGLARGECHHLWAD